MNLQANGENHDERHPIRHARSRPRFEGRRIGRIPRRSHRWTMRRAVGENLATRADLAALEQRITIRLGGLIVAGVAFLAILIKLV